jgi:hypothetical protein
MSYDYDPNDPEEQGDSLGDFEDELDDQINGSSDDDDDSSSSDDDED